MKLRDFLQAKIDEKRRIWPMTHPVVESCFYRGDLIGKVECPPCGTNVQLHIHRCGLLSSPNVMRSVTVKDCERCQYYSPAAAPRVGVVIASLNEGQNLRDTARHIEVNFPQVSDIVIGDDGSEPPEPISSFRNSTRCGVARTRNLGVLRINADIAIFTDAHVNPPRAAFERVGRLAQVHNSFAYCGTKGHYAAGLKWEGGVLRAKWLERPDSVRPTSSWMGAWYAAPVELLKCVGGWPALPGHFGYDEECTSIIAAAHGIPILCDPTVQIEHLYREQGPEQVKRPYELLMSKYLINIAATFRICFGQKMWKEFWQPRLAELKQDVGGKLVAMHVPENLLASLESPGFGRYADAVQERFKFRDEALMAEIERRMQYE